MKYRLFIYSYTKRIHHDRHKSNHWSSRFLDIELAIIYYNWIGVALYIFGKSVGSNWIEYSGFYYLNQQFQVSDVIVVDFLLLLTFFIVMKFFLLYPDHDDPWWEISDKVFIDMIGVYVDKHSSKQVSLFQMMTTLTKDSMDRTMTMSQWMGNGAQLYCDLDNATSALDRKCVLVFKGMQLVAPEYYDLPKVVTFAKLYRLSILPALNWTTKFYLLTNYLFVEAIYALFMLNMGMFYKIHENFGN